MTTDNFRKVLLAMLRRRPFKPFTVELDTGVRFEIDAPDATVVREALLPVETPDAKRNRRAWMRSGASRRCVPKQSLGTRTFEKWRCPIKHQI